jgi:thiol:disulfide interchange protein
MKSPIIRSGLFLSAVLLAGTLCFDGGCARTNSSAPVASEDRIPWRTDYTAALTEGKSAGKPILIDFSATWCPPCQQMKRATWPDSRVANLASTKYIPLAMDVDTEGAKAPGEKYGINTIPAIVVVDSDGKVIRQGSYMSADELVAFLSQ